jgi:hypothetical protein
MKKRTASLLLVFVCLIASVVNAGEFNSVIITETDSALTLDVPEHHFLRIRNFTQEGGATRGVVSATVNGGVAETAMGATLIEPGSAPSSGAEPMKKVVIAGPATITIAPVPGATLFVTYRREAEATPTPTPTVTPTVTPTPTPTVTPIPSVTPTPTPTLTP